MDYLENRILSTLTVSYSCIQVISIVSPVITFVFCCNGMLGSIFSSGTVWVRKNKQLLIWIDMDACFSVFILPVVLKVSIFSYVHLVAK